ncbi:hypothetical protein PHMEG_0009161 [Phytophthora megakarya]|uniref:Uncharacterized protein n=1 Tax=Phytophthora megakarya TaxID=4795 RepID=A0A225WGW8_9STRA|nr:hypothetical protein PHMEG_0009161 [Phytophthora megakarya]
MPRVTFAEGSTISELYDADSRDSDNAHDAFDGYDDSDNHDGWNPEESRYIDKGMLVVTNESERRQEAEGIYARPDNKLMKSEFLRGFNRDNRFQGQYNRNGGPPRKQYGPCGACGDMFHSTHFCRRRCKLCKQVYDSGRCEVFQVIANLAARQLRLGWSPTGCHSTSELLNPERDDNVNSTVLERERVRMIRRWILEIGYQVWSSRHHSENSWTSFGCYQEKDWGGGPHKSSTDELECGHYWMAQRITNEHGYFWIQGKCQCKV